MSERLHPGARFPALTLNLTDGSSLATPACFDHPYTVLLFYRGHW